jgi:hypothetical protein
MMTHLHLQFCIDGGSRFRIFGSSLCKACQMARCINVDTRHLASTKRNRIIGHLFGARSRGGDDQCASSIGFRYQQTTSFKWSARTGYKGLHCTCSPKHPTCMQSAVSMFVRVRVSMSYGSLAVTIWSPVRSCSRLFVGPDDG